MRFGPFEVVRTLDESPRGAALLVRDAAGEPSVVHTCDPSALVYGPDDREKLLAGFRLGAERQQRVAGAEHWVRLREAGEAGGVPFIRLDYHPRSARALLSERRLHPLALRNLARGIVAGLRELTASTGAGHGRLALDRIVLAGKPSPLRCRVLLTEPAADPGESNQADDLRALGEVLYEVVTRRPVSSMGAWPIETGPEWSALGRIGEAWRDLCNRLLDPALVAGAMTLEQVESDRALTATPGRAKAIAVWATTVVLLMAGALTLWLAREELRDRFGVPVDEEQWVLVQAANQNFAKPILAARKREEEDPLGPSGQSLIRRIDSDLGPPGTKPAAGQFGSAFLEPRKGDKKLTLARERHDAFVDLAGRVKGLRDYLTIDGSAPREGAWPVLAQLHDAAAAWEGRGWTRAATEARRCLGPFRPYDPAVPDAQAFPTMAHLRSALDTAQRAEEIERRYAAARLADGPPAKSKRIDALFSALFTKGGSQFEGERTWIGAAFERYLDGLGTDGAEVETIRAALEDADELAEKLIALGEGTVGRLHVPELEQFLDQRPDPAPLAARPGHGDLAKWFELAEGFTELSHDADPRKDVLSEWETGSKWTSLLTRIDTYSGGKAVGDKLRERRQKIGTGLALRKPLKRELPAIRGDVKAAASELASLLSEAADARLQLSGDAKKWLDDVRARSLSDSRALKVVETWKLKDPSAACHDLWTKALEAKLSGVTELDLTEMAQGEVDRWWSLLSELTRWPAEPEPDPLAAARTDQEWKDAAVVCLANAREAARRELLARATPAASSAELERIVNELKGGGQDVYERHGKELASAIEQTRVIAADLVSGYWDDPNDQASGRVNTAAAEWQLTHESTALRELEDAFKGAAGRAGVQPDPITRVRKHAEELGRVKESRREDLKARYAGVLKTGADPEAPRLSAAVAAALWRRLGELGIAAGNDKELEFDIDVFVWLTGAGAGLNDDRRSGLKKHLEPDATRRWERCFFDQSSPYLGEVARNWAQEADEHTNARGLPKKKWDRLAIKADLRPEPTWNLRVLALREMASQLKAGATKEAAVREQARGLKDLAPPRVPGDGASRAIRELDQKVLSDENAGANLDKVGPAVREGWNYIDKVSEPGRFARYAYTPDPRMVLDFVYVPGASGGGKAFYLCTTEASVRLIKAAKAMPGMPRWAGRANALRTVDDEKAGEIVANGLNWWDSQTLDSGLDFDDGARFPEGVGPKPGRYFSEKVGNPPVVRTAIEQTTGPNLDYPVNLVTIAESLQIANYLGCRIPTAAEWDRANRWGSTERKLAGYINVRDAAWASQWKYATALKKIARRDGGQAPFPDVFLRVIPTLTSLKLGANVPNNERVVPDVDDGYLWFCEVTRSVKPPASPPPKTGEVLHLVGNVAEFAVSEADAKAFDLDFAKRKGPWANRETPWKWKKELLGDPSAIGASAISHPDVGEEAVPIPKGKIGDGPREDAYFVDVGFRLAFPEPAEPLHDRLVKALEGALVAIPAAN